MLFDLPWLPIYLVVIFALHPLLGWTALAGAVVLITLTVFTELATRRPARASAVAARSRGLIVEDARRSRESLVAIGLLSRWSDANDDHLRHQRRTSDVAGGLGSLAKGLRLFLQSAVLAVGAYLVIHQQASAGVIIASAILANRALAPVDQAIAQWRNFVSARQCWRRLAETLQLAPPAEPQFVLPRPTRTLAVAGVTAYAPGATQPVVRNVSFELIRGPGLGIVGPSGSGKSSLVRTLVGVWQPAAGRVTLDGAALS